MGGFNREKISVEGSCDSNRPVHVALGGKPQTVILLYNRQVSDNASPQLHRVALFGGTFDPPHRGHLAAARAVRDQLEMTQIHMVVAGDPYQKSSERRITDAAIRLEMVRALVNAEPGIVVDDREVRRPGPTYTVDTLEELSAEQPHASLFVVIGADAAAGFSTWKSPERIVALSTLVIVNRIGTQQQQTWRDVLPSGARVREVMMSPVDASSTEIRARVAAEQSIDAMTTPEVARVIAHHRLYRDAS